MNIIHIIGLGVKKFGGLERYLLLLTQKLEYEGYKMIIVLEKKPDSMEYIEAFSKTNALIIILPYNQSKIKFIIGIFKLFLKYKPTIVHTHFSSSIHITKLIAYIFNIKGRFQTEHCDVNALTIKTKLSYKLIYLLNHKILCVSKAAKIGFEKAIGKFNTEKIKTLYLGVEQNQYDKAICKKKYNLPEHKTIISCVAYHDHIKGVDVLLEAISILAKSISLDDILFCMIGGSGNNIINTTKLKEISNQRNIESYILWMGIQNNVSEILTASDIYCQPSRSEGIPLSIMEAFFASLPVVGSNVGGIPEAVINGVTGYLVEKENPIQLAEKLSFLINNKEKRNEMGFNAHNMAISKFCLIQQVDELISEYKVIAN